MYEFEEYEKPEIWFLPKDEGAANEKCLQAARAFEIHPQLVNRDRLTGPYAILGRDQTLGERLGDATADDVLYLARRVKKMRQKVGELSEIINVIYDVKYCGRSLESVAREYIKK